MPEALEIIILIVIAVGVTWAVRRFYKQKFFDKYGRLWK